MKILLVEDDASLRNGLKDLLKHDGHQADVAEDGAKAVKMGSANSYDIIILDLSLPKLDGFEVCQSLRKNKPGVFILILSARNSEDSKVLGFKVGADDYMTKPFGMKELLAKIQAIERRLKTVPAKPDEIAIDDCCFDFGRCLATRGKKEIQLTPKEVAILQWLNSHRTRYISRKELLEQVWGIQADIETRTVDVTIGKLRQKIERNIDEPKIILSIKGVGYAWGGR